MLLLHHWLFFLSFLPASKTFSFMKTFELFSLILIACVVVSCSPPPDNQSFVKSVERWVGWPVDGFERSDGFRGSKLVERDLELYIFESPKGCYWGYEVAEGVIVGWRYLGDCSACKQPRFSWSSF